MKKIIPILLIAIAFCGIVLSMNLIFSNDISTYTQDPQIIGAQKNNDENNSSSNNSVHESDYISAIDNDFMYMLKQYGGKLAVFKYGENEPYEVTDIFVHNLPEYDVQLLSEGIKISDDSELAKRLEDYTS